MDAGHGFRLAWCCNRRARAQDLVSETTPGFEPISSEESTVPVAPGETPVPALDALDTPDDGGSDGSKVGWKGDWPSLIVACGSPRW